MNIEKLISFFDNKLFNFIKEIKFLQKLGLGVYQNINILILTWTTMLMILFILNNFTSCTESNLELINLYYVSNTVSILFAIQIILFIIYFATERHKFDNDTTTELETTKRINNDPNKIIILPIFMLLMFTAVKIYLYICQGKFSEYIINIEMVPILIVFSYTLFIWIKYMKQAKQSISISFIIISIIPILFICYWDYILPYIREIINLINCISSEITKLPI